jgi:hypothetical protein
MPGWLLVDLAREFLSPTGGQLRLALAILAGANRNQFRH